MNSVHIGKRTNTSIKLELPNGEYCVVFLNGEMTIPHFEASNHSSDVSMILSIKGEQFPEIIKACPFCSFEVYVNSSSSCH